MEFEASPPEHAAENAGAGDLKLSESELERIDAAFPRGPKPAVLPIPDYAKVKVDADEFYKEPLPRLVDLYEKYLKGMESA